MDRYPVELLHKIATYSCMDGGQAGCALALVSKYVRDATSRARYQTVTLVAQASVIAFAQLLDKLSVPLNTSHIFIIVSPTANSSYEEHDSAEEDGHLEGFIAKILRGMAPSLKTLFLHVDKRLLYMHDALAFPYPLLESLSISYFNPYCIEAENILPRFPVLKRLHVAHHPWYGRKWRYSLWYKLSKDMPLLETLKVSGFTATMDVPNFIRILLDVPLPGPRMIGNQTLAPVLGESSHYQPGSQVAVNAAETAARLPLLRTVFLQPGTYVHNGRCGTAGFVDGMMHVALWSLEDQTAKGQGQGKVYCTGRATPDTGLYPLKEEWLDVVCGRDGPWAVRPEAKTSDDEQPNGQDDYTEDENDEEDDVSEAKLGGNGINAAQDP